MRPSLIHSCHKVVYILNPIFYVYECRQSAGLKMTEELAGLVIQVPEPLGNQRGDEYSHRCASPVGNT